MTKSTTKTSSPHYGVITIASAFTWIRGSLAAALFLMMSFCFNPTYAYAAAHGELLDLQVHKMSDDEYDKLEKARAVVLELERKIRRIYGEGKLEQTSESSHPHELDSDVHITLAICGYAEYKASIRGRYILVEKTWMDYCTYDWQPPSATK